jgi:hypothetical protein
MVLREMTHPCPAGCGAEWHHPDAEKHRVIDQPEDAAAIDAQRPATRVHGQANAAGRLPDDFADFLEAAIRRAGGTVY